MAIKNFYADYVLSGLAAVPAELLTKMRNYNPDPTKLISDASAGLIHFWHRLGSNGLPQNMQVSPEKSTLT